MHICSESRFFPTLRVWDLEPCSQNPACDGQLNEVLQAHLLDITLKLIRDHVHADAGDAEEMTEKG